MQENKTKVVCILGPTASGKTDVSISVATQFDGEIICADSMQIYDELLIGTARPTEVEQQGIPHHLFAMIPPNGEYNVSKYQEQAKEKIREISARGKLPIVVGGTGLYINALTYELDFTEQVPNQALRDQLSLRYDSPGGPEAMYAELLAQEPEAAERIHMNDKKRLIRRLEILSGEGAGEEYTFRRPQREYDLLRIGINKDRPRLYADINRRVDLMLEQGLEQEVREVYEKYGASIQAFTAIGYKEFLPYFRGAVDFDKTVETIKRNTRRYAKRQLTWFRREQDIAWFFAEEYATKQARQEAVFACIRAHLSK